LLWRTDLNEAIGWKGFIMSQLLQDLFGHQAWAEAEHWRVIEAFAPAFNDDALRKRLHHIHLAQRALREFFATVFNQSFETVRLEDFPDMHALKEYAKETSKRAIQVLAGITAAKLEEHVAIPWLKNPSLNITVEQALTQAAMHSHYHRAQNASRMRELGGVPPTTDYILWLMNDKPEARWE
jgi:uncharacterized damage-inducible protein DinB